MQILPTSTSNSLGEMFFPSADISSNGMESSSFSSIFDMYAQDSPAEITPVLDTRAQVTMPDNAEQFATNAPYEDDDTSGLEGMTLVDKELQTILNSLLEQGADGEALGKLSALMGNPLGVRVADIVKAMAGQEAVQLTEGDMLRINSLANTLDPSGELATLLMDDIRQGQTMQAWNTLTRALQQADPDSVFSIDKQEILSLGKSLGLSNDTLTALEKTFAGQDGGLFSANGLQKLLVPAQQELMDRNTRLETLAQQLETALSPAIREAMARQAQEASAAAREQREVQHSRQLIEDSVTEKSFTRQSVAGAEQSDAGKALTNNGNTQNNSLHSTDNLLTTQRGIHFANQTDDQMNGQTHPDFGNDAQSQQQKNSSLLQNLSAAARQTAEGSESRAESPWDSLLQRVQAQGILGTAQPSSQAGQNSMNQALTNPAGQFAQAHVTEQTLAQIEQGMLTGFRDGSKTLRLQLNPVDLGAMTVLLTSHQGEVNATLRPERGETAVMLAQQADKLKAMLVEQGIKVDKVEVQTQLKDGQSDQWQWQGMEQHNDSQEHKARSEELERIRRMARFDRIGDSAAELAQATNKGPLHSASQENGLHLVA